MTSTSRHGAMKILSRASTQASRSSLIAPTTQRSEPGVLTPMAEIKGKALLEDIFGYWPSFHDAEVIAVRLHRAQPVAEGSDVHRVTLETDVHVFESTTEVDARGYYVLKNHTLVTLAFRGIDQLEMEGFNPQNALFELELKDISDRGFDALRWEVAFVAAHGMEASFNCESIEVVRAEPFDPATKQPLS
jgi:hypothetical protein